MLSLARTTVRVALATIALAAAVPTSSSSALVDGTRVAPSTFPWFATVGPLTRAGAPAEYCSGALIASRQVLTSASCAWHMFVVSGKVFVGGSWIAVSSITKHPLWDGLPGNGHDLAVLGLATTANASVVAVGAPWDPASSEVGAPATIVSRVPVGPPAPSELDVANGEVHDDVDMVATYGAPPGPFEEPFDWNAPFLIGVGRVTRWASGEPNTCADHGSPAVVRSRDRHAVIGVASFWYTGALPCTQPGGFAELTGPQLAWVAQVVPSIKDTWGPCTTPLGHPGRSSAAYLSTYAAGRQAEGAFWWHLRCDELPPPPEPVEPEDAPEPDPDDLPVCRGPIRKCEL